MTQSENARVRKEVGNQFLKAREKAGMTQAEVAAKAGIHVNYYAVIERGETNPSLEKLHSIMRVLKMSSLKLF